KERERAIGVGLGQVEGARNDWLERADRIAGFVQNFANDCWLEHFAGDKRLYGADHLKRRDRDVTLPEGGVVGVAGRPVLALIDAFPVPVRHAAGEFAVKFDTELGADAERLRVTDEIFNLQATRAQAHRADGRIAAADLIEVHVATLGN